jgi:hypothetical protein
MTQEKLIKLGQLEASALQASETVTPEHRENVALYMKKAIYQSLAEYLPSRAVCKSSSPKVFSAKDLNDLTLLNKPLTNFRKFMKMSRMLA